MKFEYFPKGVCAKKIILDINKDILENVEIIGGCEGYSKGVSALVKGKNIHEIIKVLEGIPCGLNKTSCPDQLAKALIEYLK